MTSITSNEENEFLKAMRESKHMYWPLCLWFSELLTVRLFMYLHDIMFGSCLQSFWTYGSIQLSAGGSGLWMTGAKHCIPLSMEMLCLSTTSTFCLTIRIICVYTNISDRCMAQHTCGNNVNVTRIQRSTWSAKGHQVTLIYYWLVEMHNQVII